MSIARRTTLFATALSALAALTLILLASSGTAAQVCEATWSGPATGNWTDPSWTFTGTGTAGPGYPDGDDVACIPAGNTVNVTTNQTAEGLVADGTVNIDSATLTVMGATDVNSGGVVDIRGAGSSTLTAGAMGTTLTNAGTVRTTVSGTNGIQRTLAYGNVVNSGTLDFNESTGLTVSTLTNTGAITVDTTGGDQVGTNVGMTLNMDAGSISGPGFFVMNGGAIDHDGGDVTGTVAILGGSIDPSGTGTATYSVVVSAGAAGFGPTVLAGDIAADKTIRVVGGALGNPNYHGILSVPANRTNRGTIFLENFVSGGSGTASTASLTIASGATLTTEGLIHTRSLGTGGGGPRTIDGPGTLLNAADGGIDVELNTTFNAPVTNQGLFIVRSGTAASIVTNDFVQSGEEAEIDLPGGTLDPTGASKVALGGGVLLGEGTVAGSVDNTGGVVDPSTPPDNTSQLNITGNYTQSTGGTLRIDVTGTDDVSEYDVLSVTGTADLDGTLVVDSSTFTPALGNTFEFLRAGTRTDEFETVTGLTSDPGNRTYGVLYGSTMVRLLVNANLTVSKAGTGSGTVTSSPAGVSCGNDCAEAYANNTQVTLTATPAAGSAFTGWSGDAPGCSTSTTCQVTLSQDRTVTATFADIDVDNDGADTPADCNDNNAAIKPGATDTPGNGVDEDCSGADAEFPDADGDGSRSNVDCNDGNAAIRPGATEIADNNVDEDCNGSDAKTPPPADSDNDGVPDSKDACPNEKGGLPNGCSEAPIPTGPTNGNDTLNGTDAAETICGLLGNDVIEANGGNDIVFGDLCDVKAKLAGAQAGAGGNDTVNGGTGNDQIFGAAGNDKLTGGDGNDKVFGGDGNDALSGGKGKDALDGGKGNDKLTGGADVNKYSGGSGNDTINSKNGRPETVDCGSGKKDSASVDKRDKVKGCEKVKRAKK